MHVVVTNSRGDSTRRLLGDVAGGEAAVAMLPPGDYEIKVAQRPCEATCSHARAGRGLGPVVSRCQKRTSLGAREKARLVIVTDAPQCRIREATRSTQLPELLTVAS